MQVYDIPIDSRGKELTTIGTADFPVAIYHTQLNKNVLGYVNWHWHEAIQLCLVTHGAISVTVNREHYILQKGEGCFIQGNALHMICPHNEKDSSYICINTEQPFLTNGIDNERYRKYIEPTLTDPQFTTFILSPSTPSATTILESIAEIEKADREKSFGYELKISALLQKIWYDLLMIRFGQSATNPNNPETADSRLKEILSYLQTHYNEKITLEQIACHIHLCANECCRFFKKNTGKTIFQYLSEYRIEQSIRYLSQTSLPISEIAYTCGFSSTSHFIDRFKKRTGQTPLEYRKSHK
ncbi:MAG: helix-turn-helix transcriptional regulator [Firmicutes bacterium]|nr:helix-turn-helix transcriptional regulator [Bacillota bacterium]